MNNRLDQIRKAHASARPNSTENPAFFHTHNDLGIALAEIDRLTNEWEDAERLVKRLQIALFFWLPNVPPDDPDIADRAGDDAMLLVGLDDDVTDTAESLGWVRVRNSTRVSAE